MFGAALLLATMVFWPEIFLEITNRFRWRLGLPSVGQIELEKTLLHVQARGDSLIDAQSTLLFGDSHAHGLPTSVLNSKIVNYAIAGEPAARLAKRIGSYDSIHVAHQIILFTGTNDLVAGMSPVTAVDFVSSAMQQIPHTTQILLVEVPPSLRNQALHDASQVFNIELARRCASHPRCKLIGLSALADQQTWLKPEYDSGDGIHLSPTGYRTLVNELNTSLISAEPMSSRPMNKQ